MVVRLFFVVAQAADGFLRSADQVLPASLCGVVAAMEAAEVGRFELKQQDISC